MSLSTQDKRKQTAIYHSLKEHLTSTQLLEAMCIWQTKYSATPGIAVRHFADDIAKLTNNTVRPKALVMSMVGSLTASSAGLADPSEAIAKYRASKLQPNIEPVGQEVAALCALILKLFSFTPSADLPQIKHELKESIARKNKKTFYEQDLLLWLNDSDHKIKGANTLKTLRATLNTVYTIYCEHIGPTQTDSLFSHSLRKLESNGGGIYRDIYKQLL